MSKRDTDKLATRLAQKIKMPKWERFCRQLSGYHAIGADEKLLGHKISGKTTRIDGDDGKGYYPLREDPLIITRDKRNAIKDLETLYYYTYSLTHHIQMSNNRIHQICVKMNKRFNVTRG